MGLGVMMLLLAGLIFCPVWLLLAGRLGKYRTWLIQNFVGSSTFLLFLIPRGDDLFDVAWSVRCCCWATPCHLHTLGAFGKPEWTGRSPASTLPACRGLLNCASSSLTVLVWPGMNAVRAYACAHPIAEGFCYVVACLGSDPLDLLPSVRHWHGYASMH